MKSLANYYASVLIVGKDLSISQHHVLPCLVNVVFIDFVYHKSICAISRTT